MIALGPKSTNRWRLDFLNTPLVQNKPTTTVESAPIRGVGITSCGLTTTPAKRLFLCAICEQWVFDQCNSEIPVPLFLSHTLCWRAWQRGLAFAGHMPLRTCRPHFWVRPLEATEKKKKNDQFGCHAPPVRSQSEVRPAPCLRTS